MRKFSIIMMALVLVWSATAANQPPIKDRLMTVEKALLPLTNAYKAESTAKVAAAPAKTIDLTFDNTGDPSVEYYAEDGDWYLGWPDVTNTYIVRFDYVVGFEGKFGHYTIADLDLNYSFLSDYSSGARKDVNYTDADFTMKDEGNDTWSLSGYVVCEDGNTYNLSGYYEKPQSETYDVELTDLVSAYYFNYDWYFEVANSEYSFTLDLVSESGMFAGEYTTEDALLNFCSVSTQAGNESVKSLEISIVSESLVEPKEVPAAFELTGSILTTKGNTYIVHLKVTVPLEPKQVINANVECVDYEWPTCDYPGVAGRFSFMDTDVPSRAFQVAIAQPVGEFTVGHGIVKEYTCMVENSTMMPYMVDNGTVSVTPDAEKMVLVVDAQLVCADTIQYNFTSEIPIKFDSCNVDTITYTATEILPQVTSSNASGLHTNAFNVSIISHTFSDGIGTITFVGEVTSIGDHAFYNCSSLTSLTIPNSVTSIGKSAFADCFGLSSITIPNSVTSIGTEAFYVCSGLTSITIPNSVTSIGDYAFHYCSGLTSLTIPNSVTSIGKSAFGGCSGLTSIVVESGNTNYDSRDNCNAIIKTSTNTLIAGCKNTVIPNSVTSIGDWAFSNCTGLTSITIPNSVTSIGDWAFSNCTGLTSIVVESGNTNYDSRDNCNAIIKTSTNTLIAGCKNTVIPNSVTTIGYSAFYGCSGLTSITIPNSVTSIKNAAFYNCSGLTSITIPNSVTSIGNSAFEGCSGLTSVTIPNSVTSIGDWAFLSCTGLTSITSEAVTPPSCGLNCFFNVDHSIPVYVPAASVGAYKTATEWMDFTNIQAIQATTQNIITYTATEKLTETTDTYSSGLHTNAFNVSITSHTFSNGTGTITFSGEVASIGESAFRSCYRLTSITIPNSVTSIESAAFSSCSGLTSITIPNSVTSIGESAFYKCTRLTSITIPNSVTIIGEMAFYGCSSLTSITIPNSVTSIGEFAFSGCTGLTSIVVESGNTNYDSRDNCNAIIKTSTNTLIAGCKNTVIPNSVTSIGDYAFYSCSSLTSITIPNSVTSIAGSAFDYCSGLTSIVVESGNTNYDSRDNCNAIIETSTNTLIAGCNNTVIPNSVTSIGDYAFRSCSGLTSITIPNSVTSIGWSAFEGCSGLTSITIPNSVTSIGEEAFWGCSGLTSITSEAVAPPSCGSSCFYKVDHSIPVYVPAASVGAYKTAKEWKDFTNIQAMPVSTCALTVLSSNETLGSVMGSGEFALDTTVTIAALCKMDVVFSGWSDGNTDNPRQVTLTSDSTITAYFKEVEEAEYTIEVSAYNPALGTATATEMVLVEAVPYSGCTFVRWSDGNAENPRYIPLTGDINLQAIFSGTPTSVAETTDKAQGIVRKLIVDGQLHIIHDEKIYTVEGSVVK